MPPLPPPAESSDRDIYHLYDLLDRLEELLEIMDELGVRSADEAIAKMEALHASIDALEEQGAARQ